MACDPISITSLSLVLHLYPYPPPQFTLTHIHTEIMIETEKSIEGEGGGDGPSCMHFKSDRIDPENGIMTGSWGLIRRMVETPVERKIVDRMACSRLIVVGSKALGQFRPYMRRRGLNVAKDNLPA